MGFKGGTHTDTPDLSAFIFNILASAQPGSGHRGRLRNGRHAPPANEGAAEADRPMLVDANTVIPICGHNTHVGTCAHCQRRKLARSRAQLDEAIRIGRLA